MDTADWTQQDHTHCWHPFTQQLDWEQDAPLLLTEGQGVWLTDSEGTTYLDGNSSIWTNIHGHNHPTLNAAVAGQLQKVAHTSYLGYAHPLASELAARLCGFFPPQTLERCFFSDNGSTALEVAMKMSLQSRQQTQGSAERTGFLCFSNAYHGDTMGAASLGGVGQFFDRFAKLGLPVQRARTLEDVISLPREVSETLTALVIEPLIQGVNQMTPWPSGMLHALREWCDQRGVHLILDEVMTGFGRTGTMFACQQEDVIPDFLCLAKGLTAGYLPLAATLTTNAVYETFLGDASKTFFYGHSYTANQLGCAAALASLDLFKTENTLDNVAQRSAQLAEHLAQLAQNTPRVYQTRQLGLVSGIDLRYSDGDHFDPALKVGKHVCEVAKSYGVLTRPIRDTIVLMPPLCISHDELAFAFEAITRAIEEVVGLVCDT